MSISIDPDLHKLFRETVEDVIIQALEAGAELPQEFELRLEDNHYQSYWDTFDVAGHRVRIHHVGRDITDAPVEATHH